MEEKVKIYHAKNQQESEKLLLFLKANGIEGFRQELGEGAYRDIYGGNSWYGEEVLVAEPDEKRAKMVVQAFMEVDASNRRSKKNLVGKLLIAAAVILVLLLGGATWIPRILG